MSINERLVTLEVEYRNLDEKVTELKTENKDAHDRGWVEIQKLRIEMGIKSKGARGYYIVGAIVYAMITGNLSDLKALPIEFVKLFR